MKAFFLLFFLGTTAMATEYQVSGSINLNAPLPNQNNRPRVSSPAVQPQQSKLRGGVELGTGNFMGGTSLSSINGLGILGDYKLDRKWSAEARMFFSQYSLSQPYYYSAWGGWNGDWDNWYRGYWNRYQLGSNTVGFNQVDLSIGPNYRLLSSRFSPVFGAFVQYSHKYYSVPSTPSVYYGYYNTGYGGSSDSVALGALVGVEYQLDKDISIGADLRFVMPIGSTSASTYYPGTPQSIDSLNYYIGSVNLKFGF